MTGWALLGLGLLALVAVARLGAWAQQRGWVNFRGGSAGGGAGALGAFQQLAEPQSRHVHRMADEKPPARADAGDR